MKAVTGKPALMRKINRDIIIKTIMREGDISRSQLASQIQVALPTVMRIVDGLVEEGLVEDIGKGDSAGGRKPSMIGLKKDAMYFIGVEVAEKISVILVNLGTEVVDQWSSKAKRYDNPNDMMSDIWRNIDLLIEKNQIDKDKIAGIGVGIPGTNFKHSDKVQLSVFRGWDAFDVEAWVKEHSKYNTVLENVARAHTLGELWFGLGNTYENFVYVFVDQGVGSGIVIDGKIFNGHNHVAGEFGHTVIEKNGKICYCGNNGCVEMYTSSEAIIGELQNRGFNDVVGQSFKDIVQNCSSFEANEVLEDAGEMLGIGLANLINILAPNAIILGGEVCRDSNRFVERARSSALSRVFSRKAVNIPIHVTEINADRSAIGSVALVFNELFEGIKL